MVFEIKEVKNSKVDRFYRKSMKELGEFFGINWKYNPPKVILVPNREIINSLNGEKTEDWFVGWDSGRTIYLLSPKNYEKDSCHKYSDEDYFSLIKHELTHCFLNVALGTQNIPRWLDEGISVYVSGQNNFREKPKKFEKFLSFYDKFGKGVYSESGFAVELLVRKYGKKRLLNLINKSGECKNEKEFKRLFKKIYGFELNYKNFNILIK